MITIPGHRPLTAPRVVAGASVVPWGDAADGLPGAAPETLPELPGFVVSRFSPLVAAAVDRCLGDRDVAGPGTAVLLGTVTGDTTTADTAVRARIGGQVRNPLLFFQSVPSSVIGALCAQRGITGSVTCLSGRGEHAGDLLEWAALLLDDPYTERVLLIAVELEPGARAARIHDDLGADGSPVRPPRGDCAVALLLDTTATGEVCGDEPPGTPPDVLGWLGPLVAMCPDRIEGSH